MSDVDSPADANALATPLESSASVSDPIVADGLVKHYGDFVAAAELKLHSKPFCVVRLLDADRAQSHAGPALIGKDGKAAWRATSDRLRRSQGLLLVKRAWRGHVLNGKMGMPLAICAFIW
ncbi:MAG: hypothetical protein EA401_14050 [Planctomycetota bacterium]|nr:MAG: hypothetical protein EA401_14050 [Planctomycetota bacterium]